MFTILPVENVLQKMVHYMSHIFSNGDPLYSLQFQNRALG